MPNPTGTETTQVNEHGQPVGPLVHSFTSRPWPVAKRLVGRHVTLAPLAQDDSSALFDALGGDDNASLWTYRLTDAPSSCAEMADLVEAVRSRTDIETWTVIPHDRDPAGMTSLMRIEPTMGQVEAADVIFARHMQRTAASTEATHLLMRWAFDELGYRRFEWKCNSLNEPSRRAAARLGFSYEGRFRQHMVVKGRNRDTDWFSVTDNKWPLIRAEHERWLSPNNFDQRGTQLTSLTVGGGDCGREHS